jgi:hypothetical protein
VEKMGEIGDFSMGDLPVGRAGTLIRVGRYRCLFMGFLEINSRKHPKGACLRIFCKLITERWDYYVCGSLPHKREGEWSKGVFQKVTLRPSMWLSAALKRIAFPEKGEA